MQGLEGLVSEFLWAQPSPSFLDSMKHITNSIEIVADCRMHLQRDSDSDYWMTDGGMHP